MSFLLASRIYKTYKDKTLTVSVLEDCSFTAEEGEIISLMGPSGCGKTTLLRILAGLITPTEGSVLIGGETPADYRRDGKIGFVFQKPTLFPWRTVLDNVLLPAELRSVDGLQDSRENAYKLLELLGLQGFEGTYPSQLSGGMLQRTAVARALLTKPRLLLLDEPFSALDEVTRERLWLDFRKIWRQQKLTVVLVTHSLREAVYFSDRVLIMTFRPSSIGAEIAVDLPFSREQNVIDSPEFIEFCDKVRRKIIWS